MLSADELKRYARQSLLPEIGLPGQEKLKKAKVLVIGAGGLSCPALLYLAAGGIGEIGFLDDDVVDESNLQRQILYTSEDIGKRKVDIAKQKLSSLNPYCILNAIPERLTVKNARTIIPAYDMIVDGSDNFATRYLVNDACVECEKPFVAASIFQWEGQVALYNAPGFGAAPRGPTYRCLFPEAPDPAHAPPCSTAGVLGVLTGVVGIWQATEVFKFFLERGDLLSGVLRRYNLLDGTIQDLRFSRSSQAGTAKILDQDQYEYFCAKKEAMQHVIRSIEPVELKRRLDAGEKITLIDVREDDEREFCHIGGTHIPLGQILERQIEIPKQGDVVVYCKAGGRSERAVRALSESAGLGNLINLVGGILKWSDTVDPTIPKY